MKEINLNVNKASVSDWVSLYGQVSTGLKRLCHEVGRTPVPVIDTYQRLDRMRQGFYQFEPFLKWSGLPLAYEKTRIMLEDYIAQHEGSAAVVLPIAAEHFPVIRVSGLSEQEKRAEPESKILRFFREQTQIELILEQYLRMRKIKA